MALKAPGVAGVFKSSDWLPALAKGMVTLLTSVLASRTRAVLLPVTLTVRLWTAAAAPVAALPALDAIRTLIVTSHRYSR